MRIIEDSKPDLLICDAITPGESLRKVCIKASKMLPIVMLSSMDPREERRSCYLKKTHSYLTKPYSQDDLILSVNSALQNSSL
jgi:DNA-binding response OmpR family regulator